MVINNEVVSRIELRVIDCLSGNVSWTHTFLDLDEGYGYPIIYEDILFLICSDKIYALKSSRNLAGGFLGLDFLTWAIIIAVLAATMGIVLILYRKKRRERIHTSSNLVSSK